MRIKLGRTCFIIGLMALTLGGYCVYEFAIKSTNRSNVERIFQNLPQISQMTIQHTFEQEKVGHAFNSESPMQAEGIASILSQIVREHAISIEEHTWTEDAIYTSIILVSPNGTQAEFRFTISGAGGCLDYRAGRDSTVINLDSSGLGRMYILLESLLRESEMQADSDSE